MHRAFAAATRLRGGGSWGGGHTFPCPHAAVASLAAAAAAFLAASHTDAGAEGTGTPATTPAPRPSYAPCPEVACKSSEELAALFADAPPPPRARRRAGRDGGTRGGGDGGAGGATAAATAAAAAAGTAASASPPSPAPGPAAPSPPPPPPPSPPPPRHPRASCPPGREEVGNAAWTFLHATAAYYPDAPTPAQQRAALGLVDALRELFPCTHCRAQLALDLQRLPPAVASRAEFAGWVCAQHNMVNELLGKPAFPCDAAALDERWRTGRRECWVPSGGGAAAGAQQSAEESLGQADDDDDDDDDE